MSAPSLRVSLGSHFAKGSGAISLCSFEKPLHRVFGRGLLATPSSLSLGSYGTPTGKSTELGEILCVSSGELDQVGGGWDVLDDL